MQDVDKIALTDSPAGTIVPVKASPGASRSRIVGALGGRLKVAVSAAPEKGKANAAIAALLAEALGVAARRVRLASGPTNPSKSFLVEDLRADDVREALRRL
ncbi:MAG: DUF167 domain-containing protein [Planctomycetes bacterium]|nr:DUF167 domain-containing protein [Planctomycetota bacterium]